MYSILLYHNAKTFNVTLFVSLNNFLLNYLKSWLVNYFYLLNHKIKLIFSDIIENVFLNEKEDIYFSEHDAI